VAIDPMTKNIFVIAPKKIWALFKKFDHQVGQLKKFDYHF
jgi:hypothetical protein